MKPDPMPRTRRLPLVASCAFGVLATLSSCGRAPEAGAPDSPQSPPPAKHATLPATDQETDMPQTLHIALQDGFDNDSVAVSINREQAYSKDAVKTDTRIGLADAFELPLGEGLTRVELSFGDGKQPAIVELDFAGSVYLAVSIVEGRARFRVSDQPFRYM